MNVHAARRDQRRLRDEKKNPASEDRAVNVNQSIGERSLKNAGKVIGVSEADKNGEKNEERHGARKRDGRNGVLVRKMERRWTERPWLPKSLQGSSVTFYLTQRIVYRRRQLDIHSNAWG
jgi:hypothetical protein